ncbi:hypothetical protein [Sphingomonas flavalba]|uniref:hypothetical protein n=1 Tax=Sphingomonas flavalba TaxID=2559804 RepID=UPI00109DDA90|nr:hypothetical protein [Sphingomonas flavalba]
MIACDHFLFLHLHKSGGTFVNQLLLRCIAGARQIGYHLPYAMCPDALRGLPVLGTVRNPYAYYVSWFAFQSGLNRRNALFEVCSEGGTLDFAATTANLLRLHQDDYRIDRLAAALPEQFVGHGLNLTRSCIEGLRGSGLGFYTFLHDRLYRGAVEPAILPAEDLRAGLSAYLGRRLPDMPPLARLYIDQAPAMNRSRHADVASYYDAPLRALVAAQDAPVIERYRYAFPL